MTRALLYWILMAILGIIHLQEQFKMLPIKIPIYIICLVVLGVIYFFFKKTLLGCNVRSSLEYWVLLFTVLIDSYLC